MYDNIVPIPLSTAIPTGSSSVSGKNRFGTCMRCGAELEESEYAIGDLCESCRPQYFEDWDSEQERLAEEAAEARFYPEESDDDFYDYDEEE